VASVALGRLYGSGEPWIGVLRRLAVALVGSKCELEEVLLANLRRLRDVF